MKFIIMIEKKYIFIFLFVINYFYDIILLVLKFLFERIKNGCYHSK